MKNVLLILLKRDILPSYIASASVVDHFLLEFH